MSALRIVHPITIGLATTLLVACAATHPPHQSVSSPALKRPLAAPFIVSTGPATQCVPYARQISNIRIQGDAWTWWRSAGSPYARSKTPQIGAVLVLSKTDRLRYGHLAVVTQIVGQREILVEHANWLNRGRIHKNQLVRDVSRRGDWSQVRLWYTPGNTMGVAAYPVSGFVLAPTPALAKESETKKGGSRRNRL